MIRHRKKTIVGGFHNIFKRVYAQTIGADIVPVQPMSEPKGNQIVKTNHIKRKVKLTKKFCA